MSFDAKKSACPRGRRGPREGGRSGDVDRTPRSQDTPPVVLAISARSRPRVALLRAAALARRMGAPLVVAVIMPTLSRVNALFPERNTAEIAKRLEREGALVRRVWRWCDRNLLEPLTRDRLVLAHGDVVEAAAGVAKERRAQLILVSELDVSTGRDVAALAELSGISVMLARGGLPRNSVIAASDLTLKRLTVLREGAAIAALIGAPLTIVHNIEPLVAGTAAFAGDGAPLLPVTGNVEPEQLAQRSERLAEAARDVDASDHTIAMEADTAEAILGLARRRRADLVVVGHRRRSWLRRLLGASVAAAVVDRSAKSVLVVPLDAKGSEEPNGERRGCRNA